MPQARKSTRSSSARRSAFKEPAALKKLNQSLDSAQKALTDLRRHAGSDAASGTKTLYKGLGKFVTDARKDTTKFSSALRKDFEQAAKAAQSAAKKATGSSRRSSTSTKSSGSSRSTGSSTRRKSSSSSRSGGSSTRRSTRRSS